MSMPRTVRQKITKSEFYEMGGFSNPKLFRITRYGKWQYFSEQTQ